MNILLNLYPVQSGGGQQVASNLLKVISEQDFGHSWFVFVGESSELHLLAKQSLAAGCILSFQYSYLNRLSKMSNVRHFIFEKKIDIIFNYASTLPIKLVPQVVRSVYSNLYFPEIDFWKSYSFVDRMRKYFIDKLRLRGTLKADGLIFENKSMQDRAHSLFQYPEDRTRYIAASVTQFDEHNVSPIYPDSFSTDRFDILYLSSFYLNKNIHILPRVARYLKDSGSSVRFILSLDERDEEVAHYLTKPIMELEVSDYFVFVGKVKAVHVHQVVKLADAMILLSKLECFSSNIIEAFFFRKPLIVADEAWSRALCDDAVYYVNRENPKAIATAISEVAGSLSLRESLIKKGSQKLSEFPSPVQKVKEQVNFLEYIYSRK